MGSMKKILSTISILILLLFTSCSSSKGLVSNDESIFKMKENVVYTNGVEFATLKSIGYKVVKKKNVYEATFELFDHSDPSISKNFITFMNELRPDWIIIIERPSIEFVSSN